MIWRSPTVLLGGAGVVILISAVAAVLFSFHRASSQPVPPSVTPSPPSLTVSALVPRADTPTLTSHPATPIVLTVAATLAASPTRQPPPQPAPVVVSTVVSLGQITPISANVTTWKRYANPNERLALRYPPDWTVVTSPGTPTEWVSFFPPSSDPNQPSPNITVYFWPTKPFPTQLPANIVVGSLRGREAEHSGQPGVGAAYTLLVSYGSGTLEFTVSHDLALKPTLRTMLGTLTLSPSK